MDYARTSPAQLARAIADGIGRPAGYRPIRPGGAARAAAMIAELL